MAVTPFPCARVADRLNPYLKLGLRCNPFITEDIPGVPAELWIDRGYSTPPSPSQQQLVQIMGVEGAGKTSHLKHWQACTGGPYCYYPPGLGGVKLPPIAAIAYWDEANRIPSPFQVIAFAQARIIGATIVAGTHANLGSLARRCGLSVTTIHLRPFNAETLLDWANLRINAVRVPNQDCSLVLQHDQASELAKQANGSWREVSDRLHIWAAEQANIAVRNG
ncbi:MAG: hypothetical protein AB4050_05610 [Synechococcus sp.]